MDALCSQCSNWRQAMSDFEAALPRYSIGYLSPLDVTDYDASEFYRVVPSEVLLVILPLGIEEFSDSDV
jgi:hypothetical protein